jgi:hypothetical protein
VSTATARRFSYLNLEISEKGISEFSGNRRIVFVPRENIQSIEVRFGSNAERPLLQIIAGMLLAGLGYAGAVMVFDNLSPSRGLRWGLGLIFFGCLGIWMFWEALRRSHYLLVITRNDRRKLIFKGRWAQPDFDKFAKDAAGLSYQFRDCLSESN